MYLLERNAKMERSKNCFFRIDQKNVDKNKFCGKLLSVRLDNENIMFLIVMDEKKIQSSEDYSVEHLVSKCISFYHKVI